MKLTATLLVNGSNIDNRSFEIDADAFERSELVFCPDQHGIPGKALPGCASCSETLTWTGEITRSGNVLCYCGHVHEVTP